MGISIGLLLFEDAEELDFVGPWEVFTAAIMGREAGDRVFTVSERGELVRCAKGLRVLPDYTFADSPAMNVVLVPGGQGTRREMTNEPLLEWLRPVGEACDWVTSVCTGVLLTHASGLARGKTLTTHWSAIDLLRERAPDATVLDDVRYVQDGNVVSAAGVSAGIDMALWLVGQLWSEDHARATQRYIQYDPEPPYAEVPAP